MVVIPNVPLGRDLSPFDSISAGLAYRLHYLRHFTARFPEYECCISQSILSFIGFMCMISILMSST
jgi:hypothetical protein